MPNIKSAKKRVKVGAVKKAQNQITRSVMRSSMKKVRIAVQAGDRELADALYRRAVSAIDKAVKRGVVHRNTAANKKSGLAKMIGRMAAA